jgi:glutathione S-transferase
MDPLLVIVTVACLMFYIVTLGAVGRARAKHGVPAPLMTGPAPFERAMRIQSNTVEGLVVFLPSLWMFAYMVDAKIASGLGVVWIIGRVVYMASYMKAPEKRTAGFGIQALATVVLLIGALIGGAMHLAHSGL